jgi:hypothetical protein
MSYFDGYIFILAHKKFELIKLVLEEFLIFDTKLTITRKVQIPEINVNYLSIVLVCPIIGPIWC